MKKVISFILALMLLASAAMMLPSCEKTPGNLPDESSDSDTGEGVETDPPVVLGDFVITSEVKIIRPDKCDQTIKNAAESLAKAIQDSLGITCRVTSDWNSRTGAEIMIGECKYREDSVAFNEGFYPKGYGYAVLSKDAINISAHETENVYRAVKIFITDVIENKVTTLPVGSDFLKNNEKPDVDYSINGQPLDSFVIVCENAKEDSAVELKEYIGEYLLTTVDIVSPAEYKGGNAIKIGAFGTDSYGSLRYKLTSATENGNVIITLDGETAILRKKAAELLRSGFMTTDEKKVDFAVPESLNGYRTSMIGGTDLYQVSSEEKELARGVTYYRKHYNNNLGNNVDVYIVAVKGDSEAKFGAYVADFDTKSGKEKLEVKTVGTLASEFEKTGVNVLAACNAGYFHMQAGTNYPYGMQIVDGKVVWEPSADDIVHSNNWVGVTFDGKMVSGNTADYENTYKGKIRYGVGCGYYLMHDGKLNMQKSSNGGKVCYTAIALTKDDGFVVLVVDGRPQNGDGKSDGCAGVDLVSIFWDLGLEYTDAYMLDGGGSSEMVLKDGNSFPTQNSPSDVKGGKRGNSRPVTDIVGIYIP